MPDIFATPDDTGDIHASEVQSSLGEQLGAEFKNALDPQDSLSGAWFVRRGRELNAGGFSPGLFQEGMPADQSVELERQSEAAVPDTSIDDAKSRVKQEGLEGHLHLPDQPSIKAPVLDLMIQEAQERRNREAAIARGPQGFYPDALGMITSIGAGMLDPVNAAAFSIPVVGEARWGKIIETAGDSIARRAALNAARGAAQGAVGTAVLQPADWWLHTRDGQDYTFSDVLKQVALGAGMGAAAHGGLGAAGDALARLRGRPLAGSPADLLASGQLSGVHVPGAALSEEGATHDHIAEILGFPQEPPPAEPDAQAHPVELYGDLPPAAQQDALRVTMADMINGDLPQPMEMLQVAADHSPRIAESFDAYHGSPHDFDRFDISKIGTGEGAQVFGHGLYFAENESTALDYQRTTTNRDFIRKAQELYGEFDHPADAHEAIGGSDDFTPGQKRLLFELEKEDWLGFEYPHQAVSAALSRSGPQNFDMSPDLLDAIKAVGNIYKVRITADQSRFLDWDKPLKDQAESVIDALAKAGADASGKTVEQMRQFMRSSDMTAGDWFDAAGGKGGSHGFAWHSPEEAAQALRATGVPGIKYLDQGSRDAGEGTHNFVVFNDKDVEITHKNGDPVKREDLVDTESVFAKLKEALKENDEYTSIDREGNRVPASSQELLDRMAEKYGADTDLDQWSEQDYDAYFAAIDRESAAAEAALGIERGTEQLAHDDGFDTSREFWHGTTRGLFTDFREPMTDNDVLGPAIYLGATKALSHDYGPGRGGDMLGPFWVRGNIVKPDTPVPFKAPGSSAKSQKAMNVMGYLKSVLETGRREAWGKDMTSAQYTREFWKRLGVDGYDSGFEVAIYDPKNIKAGFSIENGKLREHVKESAAAQARAREEITPLRSHGFPDSAGEVISSYPNDQAIKASPDYRAGKSGDALAALRLVEATVKPETIEEAKQRFGADAIYAPVVAEEATGHNAIPHALAAFYADQAGGTVDRSIVQANRAHHTGAGPMERLAVPVHFTGDVVRGGRYVIVDDVSVMGSTLAGMADHIQRNGGEVAGVVTLANASRTGVLRPAKAHITDIERRYGNEVRSLFHTEPAALTGDEATYIRNFRDADALRAGVASALRKRQDRLGAEGPGGPEGPVSDLSKTPSSDAAEHAAVAARPKAPRGRAAADPKTWSLFEMLAHEGGLKPDPELEAIFGSKKGPFVPGFGALLRPEGRTLDDALRLAKDLGYMFDAADVTGAEGRLTPNDLLDRLAEESAGRKQYRHDQAPSTKAEDVAAAEREKHDIIRHLHEELESATGQPHGAIDPRLEDRVVEIMTREGERDVLAAFERAIMEDAERYEGLADARQQHDAVNHIPGWDADERAAAPGHGAADPGERGPAGFSAGGEGAGNGGQSPGAGRSARPTGQAALARDQAFQRLGDRPPAYDAPEEVENSRWADNLPEPASVDPKKSAAALQQAVAEAEQIWRDLEPYLSEEERRVFNDALEAADRDAAANAQVLKDGAACLSAAIEQA